MKTYIGTKVIKAEPMRLMAAERVLNRKIKDGDSDGYLVTYADGYSSWSPRLVFEKAYRHTNGITFGLAIEAAKLGKKISRTGWNGKGLFVVYQKGYPQG
uniref:Thoeris anti-defense Tad2 family protein n=1 Tax=Pectinatus frisingensis TaxID=865 RepID=UPI0018C77766